MTDRTRVGELEEAIRDARERLARIVRQLDQGNTRLARQITDEVGDDLFAALRSSYRHPGPMGVGVVPSTVMSEPTTRAFALLGELYSRWEPSDNDTQTERMLWHEAARVLFQLHPCDRCRVFWSDRGNACPEHRVDWTARP